MKDFKTMKQERPLSQKPSSSATPQKKSYSEVVAAVTPSPRVPVRSSHSNQVVSSDTMTVVKKERPSWLDFLITFLSLSETESTALEDCFADAGMASLEDVEWLQEKDLDSSSVSRVNQRKLLCIAEFLQRGGSLKDVQSMKEVVSSVHAASSSSSGTIQSAKNDTNDEIPDIVNLNVGGYKFTTSRETLCRVPNTVLEAMFSGRHKHSAKCDGDGAYVIDRNGVHFHHVLDFLRVGAVVSLPSDAEGKEALAMEADYYGLDALALAIRMPQTDTSSFLSEQVLTIRKQEDELRQAFASGEAGFDEHHGLISLFEDDVHVESLPLKYEREVSKDAIMDKLRTEKADGIPVTVKSIDEFHSNFNREHPNMLHRLTDILLEERVILAGGSVLRALTSSGGIRTAKWWGDKSDIDMFVYCRTPEEANRVARRIFYALAWDNEQWAILRSRGVITMHSWTANQFAVDQKVQVVLRLYESPTEVLVGFDCDCCCCAYDGRSVWVTPRCLSALKTGINILNPLHAWPNKASYELRLAKYARRGFAVVVPGLDKKRIDSDRMNQTKLRDLKGMARLMKVAFAMDTTNTDHYVPYPPQSIDSLRPELRRTYSDSEILVNGMGGYEEVDGEVILPSVYCDGEPPEGRFWWYGFGLLEYFPRARDCREEAWDDIEDATDLIADRNLENVAALLVDAWDRKKRSREYLNAAMDKFDLDNLYYSHAYLVADDKK